MTRSIESGASATARRPVLAIVENLFDAVPITEAARRLGVQVVVARPGEGSEICRREAPRLILVDLAAPEAFSLLRNPALQGMPIVGFYPHVDQALRRKALEAGLGRVLPRSAFFDRLPELLEEPAAGSHPTRSG